MKRVTHRALSLLLSLTLLFSLIPGTALAAGNGEISSVNLGSTGLSMELDALPAIDTATKVEVQVYSGDTLLTAVKLTSDSDKRAELTNLTHLTCCIPTGTADPYWPQTPDWKPRADLVPTKAVLIVNDAEADTFSITNIDAVDWAGRSDVAPAPSGSIERVGITEEDTTLGLRNAVSVDLKNVTFYQSVQVKLYSGGTLLTTATLTGVAAGSHPFMTCCIATETPDAYWALTDWTPKDDVVPDKAELWVDGVKQDEKPFTLDEDEWAELPGVKQMLNVQFRNWNATTGDYSHQWSGDVENGAVINVARPTVVPTIEHLVKQKVENTSGGNRYEFKGWTTDPDDPEGRKFDPYADQVTSDLVLYPVFKQVFNVQFKNWNAATGEYGHQWSGDVEKDAVIDVARATLVPLIENIVKNNVDLTLYKFEGWTTDPDDPEDGKFDPYTDPVSSDLVLYPVFTPTTFTVTFNSNGGTEIEAQTVQYGGKATEPTTTKTGYTFQGWFLDEGDARREYDFDTLVTGPITLTAQWTPITYTIVYHGNGGVLTSNGDKDQSTSTCTYDQEFTLKNAATFTRTGFAFQGWSTTENGGVVYTAGQTGVKNLASVQGEKVDLYAVWEGNAYTVTFNADGGSLAEGDQSKTVTYDSTYGALPTPTKTGYTFAGWYLGETEITTESMVETAENHTLTAKWTANSYTIRYNHNDGDPYHYIQDAWAKYNQEATIYSPYYSIEGHTLLGWAFTADATAPVYKVGQKVVVNEINFPGLEDLKSGGVYHLYAVWKANEYTVSFIDNGVEVGTQNFVYDIAQNLTAYTGTKPGCVFQGWDVDNDGDVDYTDGALVKNLTAENNGKVELVAVWKDVTPPEVDYTVSAGDTENNRYVVIKANEPIQQPANGWSKVENKYVEPGTQWKMPHLEYGKVYNFTIKDLAGNETPLTIDLKAPVVTAEYDPATLTNQNVTVTLTFDEAVTISDDWTQIDAEGKVYKKTFAENTTETVEFADTAKYPNAGTYKVVIDYIDKIAPKVSYVINGNQVIISADEVIQSPAKGWSKVENKYTTPGTKWKRTVTRGTSIDLNIKDLAGNVTPLTIDLEAPVATVSYDPTEITESSVVVTISFDELTKITSEDWAATGADADGFATKWTKTYTANTTETVDFVDAVKNDGNKSSVEVKVDNIRIPLNVTINGNTKTVTYNGKEQNVKAVLPNAATLPAEVTIAFKDGVVPSVAGSRAGTYTRELTEDMFTVNGGGKYNVYLKFEGKLELVIEPKDIKDAVVSDIAAVTYNGQEQKPTGFDVTVKLGYNWDEDTVLSSTTDYDVSYSNNINAGTATVTITGKGNYTGEVTKTFEIIIATYTGSFDVNVTYDGTRPLRGAKFGLYTNAACTDLVMTATTDTDGRATFTLSTEIEPNSTKTLYLKQISAPAGYSKDSNTYTVVLTPDGKSFTAEIATMTTVRTFARAATVAVGETGGSIDIVNPPVISSGSSASSTIVTFVAGDEYALEAQKGTSAKTDGSVQVSLSGTKVAENKVPDVIPADAYYEFIDWAIENKDGELTTIDLETYKFTKNNIKIYAIMEDTWTPYIDMKKDRSDWYYQYVRDLSIASVVGGYPDGTFGSRNEVTWGQALKLIMLAVGYDVQEPVEGGHWASGYLMKALQDGLVSADQNIDLNAPLSRVEYARVAYAAMGLKLSKIDNPFIDTDDASVIALYEAGIVEGSFNANGRVFKPEDNISRAEMSAVIWRIMNYER